MEREIRALYDADSITVYQAYNKAIAESAVTAQTFVSPPFKKERMTWIKPSFCWMMYRCGWAEKENQEHVLAIKLKRQGFTWALRNSCLSHYDKTIHQSYEDWQRQLHSAPVRIQWDPEKNIHLQPLPYRSIQIGLSGPAVDHYINNWIIEVADITTQCKEIHQLLLQDKLEQAKQLLPQEEVYPVDQETGLIINRG